MKRSAAVRPGPCPAPPPAAAARAGGGAVLRVLPRCLCGESPLLHAGARGDGACLLPRCSCAAYREVTRADPR